LIVGKHHGGRGSTGGRSGRWTLALGTLSLGCLLAALGSGAVPSWPAGQTSTSDAPGPAVVTSAPTGHEIARTGAAGRSDAVAPPSPPASLSGRLDADELAYLTWAEPSMEALGHSVRMLDELLTTPRLDDPDWRRRAATEVAVFRRLYDEAGARMPPPSLRPMHSHLLAGTSHFSMAATLVQKALGTGQASFLELAATEVTQGLLQTQQAEETEAVLLRKRGLKA
jgi:hypothetical protein